jgi:small conductance mechanosensitive channel
MMQEELGSALVSSVIIVALTTLALVLVQYLAKRALNTVKAMQHLREMRRQQLVTFVQLGQWGVSILIAGSTLLMLLSTIGLDITPFLASAGVAGLAVTLGAQSLIRDFIGGLLILIENQFAVGDSIQVGAVSGEVEQITLRATYVRDITGHLFVVPNGDVRVVANQTKGWSRALVDVGVAYQKDLDRVRLVLEESGETFAQDEVVGPQLLEPPQILGPLSLGAAAITMRVMVKTLPGKQWEVARKLRQSILVACAKAEINLVTVQ